MTDHTDIHDVEDATHRAGCADCRALWAELEAIGAEAARLPSLTPSRDLWAGIEARITAAPRRIPLYERRGIRLAMAASLLVAASSALTWQLAARRGTALPAASIATATPDGSVAPEDAERYRVAVASSVNDMDREIAALEGILGERRTDLDPQTVEVLERNLAVIDAAIAEARAALAADPASQFLAQRFARAYTSKLTLLRGAAQLPAGT